jgi:hypothetical protein
MGARIVFALVLRTAEFFFYDLLLVLVDRVSRLPRGEAMPEAMRLYRENIALKAQLEALERFGERCPDLFLDEMGGHVADAGRRPQPAPEKRVFVSDLVEHRAHTLAHSEAGHHAEREIRGLPQIALRTARRIAEEERLGCVTAHEHRQPGCQGAARGDVALGGHLLARRPERSPAWKNGDTLHRLGPGDA